MGTRLQLKISSHRLEKGRNKHTTPGLQEEWFTHYMRGAPQVLPYIPCPGLLRTTRQLLLSNPSIGQSQRVMKLVHWE